MGAKTSILVFSASNARDALAARPALDRSATEKLLQQVFQNDKFEVVEDTDLSDTFPDKNKIHVGAFSGVSVLAAREFAIDYPSRLPAHFISAFGRGTLILHVMLSVADWFAYAVWADGKLVRSLSLSPDSGIIEDIGERLSFEIPYWDGDHPVFEEGEDDEGYPFVFHPLDMGGAALNHLFGYQLEGPENDSLLEPEEVPLACYQRVRSSWWKFW